MNEKTEMIKGMSISLLEEVQEIARYIDLDHRKQDTYDSLEEIVQLLEKVKVGILKIN